MLTGSRVKLVRRAGVACHGSLLAMRHAGAFLLSAVGLRRLVVHGISHSSLNTRETHGSLSFLVGGGLDLSSALGEGLIGTCFLQVVLAHLQVIAALVRGLGEDSQFAVVLHDVVPVEHLVDDFVVGSLVLEERIVHVTASAWVDSQHVAASLVLDDRLSDVLLVFEVGRLLERLEEGRVLDRVVVHKPFDVSLNLVTRLTTVDLLVVAATWSETRSLDASA